MAHSRDYHPCRMTHSFTLDLQDERTVFKVHTKILTSLQHYYEKALFHSQHSKYEAATTKADSRRGSSRARTTNDASQPVFLYMVREFPYGCFCQWKTTTFTVPMSSLSWLKLAHPANSSKTLSPADEAGMLEFNYAEQYMMFCKAIFFSAEKSAAKIVASEDLARQKKLGRAVLGFSDYEWRKVCERVVFEGNWWKFGQNQAFRGILMGTGERELCEASRADRVWGIGYNAREALAYGRLWGENLLGKALMRTRDQIKQRLEEHGRSERTDWDMPDMESMWEVLRKEREEKADRDWSKGRWNGH